MLRVLLFVAALLLGASSVSAQPLDHNVLPCPAPGGYALTDDLVGLVVSSPETTELIYFNTGTEKELKRVQLDFKPGSLCRQGKTLYVAGVGTAIVYAIDLATGKPQKEFELGGDAVANLACHPQKGMVYAATEGRAIFSIDPATGKSAKTSAVGKYIGVTADGASVITAFQPGEGEYDYKVAEGKRIVIPWNSPWGCRAQIVKYKIRGAELEFEAAQNNAASNGWSFHLSPDGNRVAMPGGGGWRPTEGPGGGYVTAIFGTSNLQTMLGQAPSAIGIAFHPVLDLGATSHDDGVKLFRAKSMKPVGEFKMKGNGSSALLAVCAKGTKFIFWNGTAEGQGLHFLPLELSSEEKLLLTKTYGDLPQPVEIAAIAGSPATVNPPLAAATPQPAATTSVPPPATASSTPKTVPRKTAKSARPMPGNSAFEPAPRVPIGTSKAFQGKRGKEVEITAGFNDAAGMNADKKRYSPYPVGARGVSGGVGEPGWKGPWEIKGDDAKFAAFVSDVVQEGDGALYFAGGNGGVVREFAAGISVPFEMEQYVRILEGGHLMVYVGEQEMATGPMWFAQDGKFLALNGTGQQYGGDKAIDTGVSPDPDKWHKIVLKVYPKQHEYEFYIDDKKYGERYHFRADVSTINEVRYVTEREAGFLLDAITVRPIKE